MFLGMVNSNMMLSSCWDDIFFRPPCIELNAWWPAKRLHKHHFPTRKDIIFLFAILKNMGMVVQISGRGYGEGEKELDYALPKKAVVAVLLCLWMVVGGEQWFILKVSSSSTLSALTLPTIPFSDELYDVIVISMRPRHSSGSMAHFAVTHASSFQMIL